MKKEVIVVTSVEQVVQKGVTKTIEFDYPQEDKYYSWQDDSRFFGRGLVLFAITIKYPDSTFRLTCVERGKQDYNDFVPTKDCRQTSWAEEESIRKVAWDIMTQKWDCHFKEITKEEFFLKRKELLDVAFEKL